jgi:hypothetical protein
MHYLQRWEVSLDQSYGFIANRSSFSGSLTLSTPSHMPSESFQNQRTVSLMSFVSLKSQTVDATGWLPVYSTNFSGFRIRRHPHPQAIFLHVYLLMLGL